MQWYSNLEYCMLFSFSSLPQATDSTLLEKFKQQHQDNQFFAQTPVREPAFVILHFAGKVKYQIKVKERTLKLNFFLLCANVGSRWETSDVSVVGKQY